MRAFDAVAGWVCSVAAFATLAAMAQPDENDAPVSAEFSVQSWGTSEGLPANVILNLAQTPEGYLWLGTTRGLVRFDGVRFESYLTARMPHRLGTRVEGLDVDRTGRLWIVTEQKGLLAVQDRQFAEFHTNGLVLSQLTASVCSDMAGGVWAADARGNLARIPTHNPGQIEPVEFRLPPGSALVRDGQGGLWASSPHNLSGMVAGHWRTVLQPQTVIQAVGAARGGGLWIAMDNRLRRLDSDLTLEELDEFPWPPDTTAVTCLFEDREKVVWIGTSSRGLFRRFNGQIHSVATTPRAINCLLQDTEGSLWAGTRGGGLARLRKRVFRTVDAGSGLRNEYINSVCEDSTGRIWLATEGNGLGWVEGDRYQLLGRAQGWPGLTVLALTADRQDGIWLATAGRGLWHWRSNQFASINLTPKLPASPPRCLHETRDGTVWLVLDDVALFSVANGTFQRHGPENGLNTRRVRAIAEDADGDLWAGGWRGDLWRFADERWEEIRPQTSNTEAVRALTFDTRGQLWVGTADAGLLRFRGGRVAHVASRQGLPDDDIEQMLLDGEALWLGTPKGLFHVSLDQLNDVADGQREQVTAIHHGRGEGLPERHFTGRLQPRAWRARNGELWFAAANGAVHFRPSDLAPEGAPPRAIIEKVLVNGQPLPQESLRRLRSDTRRLEFRFTAPSFTAPERLRFRCQLKGVDDDWVECGPNRTATYASVPFGTHVFRVAAGNATGAWGPETESVPLVVQPYFWQTQWFIALVAATLAGGLAWGARRATLRRLSRRLKLVEQQHALERERARISQDIHDELGANLTTIGLLADMGNRHKANPQALTHDLAQIADTARGTAAAMDAIVWALNPRNDSLDHFANYIGQFTKDFFRPTSIRTRLDLPANLPPHPMSANTRHNLFLAVKEALNNVARHAEATEVRLSLLTAENTLRLTVEDNGKGIPASPSDNGHDGLANMKERVEKLGGNLVIAPASGGGTRLGFAVPLAKINTN